MTTETTSEGRPLAGRRALVTGAASGIGRATATRLSGDGAAVAINYVGGAEPAESLARELGARGGRALAVEADVSDERRVARMFDRVQGELGGPIDLLVNNAGVEARFPVVEMSLDEWNRVLAVNLTGAFLCARQAARSLIGAGSPGVIVNVSSVHEVIPWPGYAHYCASKGGLKLFAQTLARELAPHRIRVANVGPGAIETPINQELLDDEEKLREQEAQIPWGRIGQPEEIAAAIAWLAGPDASYVTGPTLFVDGGMTLYPRLT